MTELLTYLLQVCSEDGDPKGGNTVLKSVGSLCDEVVKLLEHSSYSSGTFELYINILAKLGFDHVFSWDVKFNNVVTTLYGTICQKSDESTAAVLMVETAIQTDNGLYHERHKIAKMEYSDNQRASSNEGMLFSKYVDKIATSNWKFVRWSACVDKVNEERKELLANANKSTFIQAGAGVFDCVEGIFEERKVVNRASGCFQRFACDITGEFVVEGSRKLEPEYKQSGFIAAAATASIQIAGVVVVPAAVPARVVSAIHSETAERYYVPLQYLEYKKRGSVNRVDCLPNDFGRRSDFIKKMARNGVMPKLVVLVGPSGFGKTMLARKLCSSMGKNYIKITAGNLGLNVTDLAAKLDKAAKLAGRLDCAIIFDDADFLLSSRVDDVNRYALFQVVVNFIDASTVPILCTTNLQALDEAIVSRVDFGFVVDKNSYMGSTTAEIEYARRGGIIHSFSDTKVNACAGKEKLLQLWSSCLNNSGVVGDIPLTKLACYVLSELERLLDDVAVVDMSIRDIVNLLRVAGVGSKINVSSDGSGSDAAEFFVRRLYNVVYDFNNFKKYVKG
jgi:hypothetical protein